MIRSEPATRFRLEERLAADAQLLRAGQRCPVDLSPILDRLDLKLERHSYERLGGEGALLHGRNGWAVGVVNPSLDRPRTRFTVAHEVGHYLLEGYGVPRPVTPGDYWRTEALCHYFAGHLLVPREAVGWVAMGAGNGVSELLRRSIAVSQRAAVSPAAVSHRLNEDLSYCAFCEVRFATPRRGVIGIVDWVAERFAWLGIKARGYIDQSHFLARSLLLHRGLAPDRIAAGHVNGLPTAFVRRRASVWMLGLDPVLATTSPKRLSQLSLPLSA